jgi:hypothetical protein
LCLTCAVLANFPNVEAQFNGNTIKPETRLIDRKKDLDLATLDVPAIFVSSSTRKLVHHKPAGWPPAPLASGNLVLYGGYPGELKEISPGQADFPFQSFIVTALTRVSVSASSYISSTTSGPTTVGPPLGVPNSIAPPPGSVPRPSTVMNNTQIESFMAHLRNLIEFLFTLNPGDTDVAAVDFCARGAWNPVITQTLSDARRRVNKELAHLTTERISGSPLRKQWDFTRLAQELRPHLQDFVARADSAKLSRRIKTAIR